MSTIEGGRTRVCTTPCQAYHPERRPGSSRLHGFASRRGQRPALHLLTNLAPSSIEAFQLVPADPNIGTDAKPIASSMRQHPGFATLVEMARVWTRLADELAALQRQQVQPKREA